MIKDRGPAGREARGRGAEAERRIGSRPFAAATSPGGFSAPAAGGFSGTVAPSGHHFGRLAIQRNGDGTDYAALDRRIRRQREEELLAGKGPEELYDLLGPDEKWREHIDARHHRHGSSVYVEGKHGRDRDPDYNRAMMDADWLTRSTIGRRLEFDDYQAIHSAAVAAKLDKYDTEMPDAFPRQFRQGELPVGTTANRFRSRREALRRENVEPFEGAAGLPPLVKEFRSAEEDREDHRAKVVLADVAKDQDPGEFYPRAISSLLEKYYDRAVAARGREEKLAAIAHLHKSLENLHPYGDANTRTHRLVLNKMLVEQGMAPTMLKNPLDVHHTTEENWSREIERGQRLWLRHAARAESRRGPATSASDEWRRWEEATKREAGRYDSRAPRGLRPTRLRTDSAPLSHYSHPVAPTVREPPARARPPEPASEGGASREELIGQLEVALRAHEGMSPEGLADMSLADLRSLAGYILK